MTSKTASEKKHDGDILVIVNYPLHEQIAKGNIDILEVMFNNLLRLFQHVHVVSLKDTWDANQYTFKKGIVVHPIKPAGKYSGILLHGLSFSSEFKAIESIINKHPIKVIRAMAMLSSGLLGAKLSKKYHIPFVISIHEDRRLVEKKEKRMHCVFVESALQRLEKKVLRQASLVCVISNFVKKRIRRLGTPEQKIMLHPNFCNTTVFKPRAKKAPIKLITAGRLVKVKQTDLLIKAMYGIHQHYPNVLLYIAGDGPERAYLEQLAQDLELKKYIKFLGNISHEKEIPEYLGKSHIFLAVMGGFSVIEALASGLPCIVGDVDWTKEVIENNKNGFVVESLIPKEFAEKTMKILKSKNMQAFAKKARETAEKRFSIAAYEERERIIYEKVFKDARGA